MKKYFALAMILALTMPAAAQFPDAPRRQQLDTWVAFIVENRVKKDWTPMLYASPATAADLGPTVGGVTVTPDAALKDKILQLRNAEPFPDTHQFTRQPITVPAGSVMAEQKW